MKSTRAAGEAGGAGGLVFKVGACLSVNITICTIKRQCGVYTAANMAPSPVGAHVTQHTQFLTSHSGGREEPLTKAKKQRFWAYTSAANEKHNDYAKPFPS